MHRLYLYTVVFLIVAFIKLFISRQGNILSVVPHSVQLTRTNKSVIITIIMSECDKPSTELLNEITGNIKISFMNQKKELW